MKPCGHTCAETVATCHICTLTATRSDYLLHWCGQSGVHGAVPLPEVKAAAGPCRHLGAATGETIECPSCSGTVRLKLMTCAIHGDCTPGKPVAGHACCKECPDFVPDGPRETILPSAALAKCADGHRFNAALIDYQGRRLLAYRAGRKASQVHVCELDANHTPGRSVLLNLTHERATHGREDPRLFVHAGRLHVGYVGVTGAHGPTHCLYARLTDDLRVEQTFYPHLAGRASWEKNWVWFEWEGELFAVYTISPHVVLHVVNHSAREFQRVEWAPKWSGGLLRGGASPVLVGDEYYHWFHGCVEKGGKTPRGTAKRRVYSVGLYTFEAKPPFRPLRCTAEPLLWGGDAKQPDGIHGVVFPCGAIRDGERWLVSAGVHDSQIGVYEWDAADVERKLVKV